MKSKKAAARRKPPKAVLASPRPAIRPVRLGILVAVLGLAALGGIWYWLWRQDRTERAAALAAASQGSFREAEPSLRQVYARHPEDVELTRALGLGYLAARRFDDAELFLTRWCEMRPRETEPLMRRIELWKIWQKSSKAVADAQSVLEMHPNDFGGRLFLAQMLSFDARFAEAEQEAQRCLLAQPDNGEVWYLLATIYRRQGRIKDASDWADRLLLTLPNSVPTLVLRADLHLDAGQVEPAIKLLSRAADSPSLKHSFDTFQLSGQAYPNPLAAAEQKLDRTFVLYQLSQALARAGRDREASDALHEMQWRRALMLWTEDSQRDANTALQSRVVDAYLAAAKPEEAIAFLTEILSRLPNASGTHQLLANCYEQQGQTKRAAEQRRLSSQGK
jgi:predicted Zn-dependent protease